jgi:hypothetical protein
MKNSFEKYCDRNRNKPRDKMALGFIWGFGLTSLLFGTVMYAQRESAGFIAEENYNTKLESMREEIRQEVFKGFRENTIEAQDGSQIFAIDVDGVVEEYEIKFKKFIKNDNRNKKNPMPEVKGK